VCGAQNGLLRLATPGPFQVQLQQAREDFVRGQVSGPAVGGEDGGVETWLSRMRPPLCSRFRGDTTGAAIRAWCAAWATFDQTRCRDRRWEPTRVMAPGVHPGAIGAGERGYLPFLSFLSFFLPAKLVS
jgi:hypothetical protein